MGLVDTIRSATGRINLRDYVRTSLQQQFEDPHYDYDLGPSAADVLIEQGDKVAIVEVKTGDPEFSLPSSTSPRMLLLKDLATEQFKGKTIIPVVVTNHRVGDAQKAQLADDGIKLVPLSGSSVERFPLEFSEQVGIAPKKSAPQSDPKSRRS
jgi:hypothetical protein